MKRTTLFLFLVFASLGFQSSEPQFRALNKTFTKKELLQYDVNYGFITAGMAKIEISPEIYSINNRSCYKIDVTGKTTGAFDMIAKIHDTWGAYIDTTALLPHIAYRRLKEGGYRKYEVVKFDHKTSFLETKTYNFTTKEFKEPKYFLFPAQVQDLISSYYYLRALNFDTLRNKDTISFNTFFEDKIYDIKILYLGKEVIDTKFGKIRAIILKPLMPDNKIFSGENSITAWFSDDKNKVPLRVKAELFLGFAEVTLEKAENLLAPLALVKKE